MKKLLTLILMAFLSLGVANFAYADESEYRRYIFITSCGEIGEVTVRGVLTEEEENQYWIAFDEVLCDNDEEVEDNNDILP